MCSPTIIAAVGTWLASSAGTATMAAATTAIAGASAYKQKRRGDRADIEQREALKRQTDRQTDLDEIAATQRTEDTKRQTIQDNLAAAERTRQAERAAAAEKERQRIRDEQATRTRLTTEGRESVAGAFGSTFNPEFYQGQRGAYTDLAEGELSDKYADAAKQLLFAMTRSGLGQSSAKNLRTAKMTAEHTKAGEDIQDTAARREAALKGQVAERKAALMGQAESAQDPTYMGNLASTQASALSKPQMYPGIGDPFATSLAGLSSAFQSEAQKRKLDDYNRRMQQYGLSGSGASSVVG